MKNLSVSEAVNIPVAVATVRADAPIADALRLMRSEGIHHLVVREQIAVVGVVSDRDIFGKGTEVDGVGLRPGLTVRDVMIRLDRFVTESTSLHDALELLAISGASALPVVGPRGLAGIITESDLLKIMRVVLSDDAKGAPAHNGASVVFSNPLIQEAMRLLAQAGV